MFSLLTKIKFVDSNFQRPRRAWETLHLSFCIDLSHLCGICRQKSVWSSQFNWDKIQEHERLIQGKILLWSSYSNNNMKHIIPVFQQQKLLQKLYCLFFPSAVRNV